MHIKNAQSTECHHYCSNVQYEEHHAFYRSIKDKLHREGNFWGPYLEVMMHNSYRYCFKNRVWSSLLRIAMVKILHCGVNHCTF